MDLVVDANVLLACFKPSSITRELIANESFHLFSTEFQMNELETYSQEISKKYALSQDFISSVMQFLENYVEVVPKEEYLNTLSTIQNLISDKDDLPVLALALSKNMFIWSNDPHLKEQSKVRVFTTSELIRFIKGE